jgi:hypothetical protein
VAGGDLSEQVSVRARFERFPATVKGAFILRGEDADPHQVELRGAAVVEIGSRATAPIPMTAASLDVVPHRDVFVPFEVPIGELEPGWYTLQAELEIDGNPGAFDGGRRFSVPWPRATVRRGQVRVDRDVTLGDATVRVEHVDCGGDSAKVHLRVDPPGPLGLAMIAGGDPIEVLEVEADDASGRVKATTYPVMRVHRSLRLELQGATKGASASLDIPLPE